MRKKAYTREGKPVFLGAEIGRGGEGSVFEVTSQESSVAKLYHKSVGAEKAAKIEAMASQQSQDLLRIAAWPTDTLYDVPGGRFCGLVMPRISGYKEVHTLYGPKSRLLEFPSATWAFLISAATNLARAVAVVHQHGHVVGDINHGNILASDRAMIKLIDCDSFQIRVHGRSYPCEVGVPTHTPPELQGVSLRGVTRTPNHDAFGLAVMIFQLLFMARHPFSGSYLGPGDMPLERAIREFRFAYGSDAPARQMRQPPHTLTLNMVSPEIALLFHRAFSSHGVRDGARPTPTEWITTLENLKLRTCSRNPGHHYATTLSSCPWCAIEGRVGTLLFNVVGPLRQVGGRFDLQATWAQIIAIPSPGQVPAPPRSTSVFQFQPSIAAVKEGRKRRVYIAGGITMGLVGIALGLAVSGFPGFVLFLLCAFVGNWIANEGIGPLRRQALEAVRARRHHYQSIETSWNQQTGDAAFSGKLEELQKIRAEYMELPNLRVRKVAELQRNLYGAQLNRFLDRYRIEDASLRGIGDGRKATLESYGIETAADVTAADILRIPGFGPALTQVLLDWRRGLERKFVFNPSKGIDLADLANLDRNLAARKAQLEKDLLNGPAQLRQVVQQIESKRQALRVQLEEAARSLAQAEAELQVL